MGNQNKIRRFIPCSLYCTDKIESWLEEMAAEGYIFYTFSIFNYAVFIKDAPKRIRYRLCLKNAGKHETDMLKIMQKYGWQSNGEVKKLEIYTADGTEIQGLENDCEAVEIQNKAIKYHSKQNTVSFFLMLLTFLMYVFLDDYGISAVRFGIGALLFPISMFLFIIIKHFTEITDVKTYKRIFENKESHNKRSGKTYNLLHAAKFASLVIFIISFIILLSSNEIGGNVRHSNYDNDEKTPFAAIEEFLPDDALRKSEMQNEHSALYQKWSNSVSPVNYFWYENDIVTLSDGTTADLTLNVNYHETTSPILAKWVVYNYFLKDRLNKISSDVHKLKGYDIDFGLYYQNQYYKVVIAQKGNTVIKVEFQPFVFLSDEEVIKIICSNF